LIRKNFDGADYWSWADWHDYPLGEDEDDWEEESEFTTSSDSPCCEEEDELN
jgi:hypothetical protein